MSAEYLNKLFNLDGQIAVVIGGTGELGGMLAEGIAQAGAHVVVAGRDADRGQQRVASIQNLGGQASFAAVDVGSRGIADKKHLLGCQIRKLPAGQGQGPTVDARVRLAVSNLARKDRK